MPYDANRFPAGYDSALDAFRLTAALLVMFSHYLAGYVDVHVYFYGYAGFMVAAGYFAYRYARFRYSGREYFAARLVRLYPAFLIAALGYWLALRGETFFDYRTLINHLLFLTTATDRAQVMALNASFWVLPAFVEFYLVFALLGRATHPLVLFLIGLILVIVVTRLARPELEVLKLHLPSTLYAFALGGCLAWLRQKLPNWPLPLLPPAAVGLFFLLALVVIGSDQLLFGENILDAMHLREYRKGLFVALYAAALFALLYTDRRLFDKAPLRILAAASFSIYLFHNLVSIVLPIDSGWVGIALAAAGTIAISLIVQALIEDPIRRWFKAKGSGTLRTQPPG